MACKPCRENKYLYICQRQICPWMDMSAAVFVLLKDILKIRLIET